METEEQYYVDLNTHNLDLTELSEVPRRILYKIREDLKTVIERIGDERVNYANILNQYSPTALDSTYQKQSEFRVQLDEINDEINRRRKR